MFTYNDGTKEIKWNSWNDIVNQYPAMWIIFRKANFDGSDVVSGDIWAILPDDKVQDFWDHNCVEIDASRRTTEGAGGYIHGELVED